MWFYLRLGRLRFLDVCLLLQLLSFNDMSVFTAVSVIEVQIKRCVYSLTFTWLLRM